MVLNWLLMLLNLCLEVYYIKSIWSQPLRYIFFSIHILVPDIRFLRPEVHISGKHGHNTRHLFDLIRKMFIRTRLEFIRHHAIDLSEHVQKFHFGTIVLQNDTQGLDKPGSFLVIPPWIETWKKRLTLDGWCESISTAFIYRDLWLFSY